MRNGKIKKAVYDVPDFVLFSVLPLCHQATSWQQLLDMEGYSVLRGGYTQWRGWLRPYAIRRKVAGSIFDCVIGIFSLT